MTTPNESNPPRSYSTRTKGVGSNGTKVAVMYMHCTSCSGPHSPENEARSTHVHDGPHWRCVCCDALSPRQVKKVCMTEAENAEKRAQFRELVKRCDLSKEVLATAFHQLDL